MFFGINIFATSGTPDAKILHTSNVMAQYLDNDADGKLDNLDIVAAMTRRNSSLIMAETEAAMESSVIKKLPDTFWDMVKQDQVRIQDLYSSETNPINGFDASLEEVLHLITSAGYSQTYPNVFGENTGSIIAGYMDQARGGHFLERNASDCGFGRRCALPPNGEYPASAWYTYLDPTCDYSCMVTEYFYWTLTTILGVQSAAERCRDISEEWALCTSEQLKEKDANMFNLLTDPQYALPSIAPDGNYNP